MKINKFLLAIIIAIVIAVIFGQSSLCIAVPLLAIPFIINNKINGGNTGIELFARNLEGSMIPIEVNAEANVGDLRKVIAKDLKVNPEILVMSFQGSKLDEDDDDKLLADLGIGPETVVDVAIKVYYVNESPPRGDEFSTKESKFFSIPIKIKDLASAIVEYYDDNQVIVNKEDIISWLESDLEEGVYKISSHYHEERLIISQNFDDSIDYDDKYKQIIPPYPTEETFSRRPTNMSEESVPSRSSL